jgi:DNA polymerase-1
MEFRTMTKRISDRREAPVIEDVAVASDAPAWSRDDGKNEWVKTRRLAQVWMDRIYARGYVAVDGNDVAERNAR